MNTQRPKRPKTELSAEYVRSILAYDPSSGILEWKNRLDVTPNINAATVGKIAGSVNQGYIVIQIKRWSNLRTASRQQNCRNAPLLRSNTSGYKGVSYVKSINRWHTYIDHDRRRINLGYFRNKSDAIQCRKKGADRYHKEFARAA